MRKWGLTLLAVFFTIILTACNQNDSKDEDKKETSEKTSQKKEASQSENGEGFKALKEKEHNSQRNKKTTNDSSDNQIIDYTDKQKIAMLLFQPGLDDKFITADDVLKGEYQSKFSDGVKMKHLPKLTVTSLPENTQMDNIPTGTKFYNIQPFPSQYSVNIAMNEHNMIIFGSQSPIPDYNELLHGLDGMAKVYKTKDVIKSEKDNPKLKEVEDKVDMQ